MHPKQKLKERKTEPPQKIIIQMQSPSTTSGLETEWGYSEGKETGEMNKKGKYKQQKRKQVTRSKRKQVIKETHI